MPPPPGRPARLRFARVRERVGGRTRSAPGRGTPPGPPGRAGHRLPPAAPRRRPSPRPAVPGRPSPRRRRRTPSSSRPAAAACGCAGRPGGCEGAARCPPPGAGAARGRRRAASRGGRAGGGGDRRAGCRPAARCGTRPPAAPRARPSPAPAADLRRAGLRAGPAGSPRGRHRAPHPPGGGVLTVVVARGRIGVRVLGGRRWRGSVGWGSRSARGARTSRPQSPPRPPWLASPGEGSGRAQGQDRSAGRGDAERVRDGAEEGRRIRLPCIGNFLRAEP